MSNAHNDNYVQSMFKSMFEFPIHGVKRIKSGKCAGVRVIIVSFGKCEHQIEKLKKLFSSPIFDVEVYKPNRCDENEDYNNMISSQHVMDIVDENIGFDEDIIIIGSNTVSNLRPEDIEETVRRCLRQPGDFWYLARWNSDCQLDTVLDDTRQPTIVKTWKSNGIQALLITRHGAGILKGRKVMNNGYMFKWKTNINDDLISSISNGNIDAGACTPPIFYRDIVKANYNYEYEMVNMCKAIKLTPEEEKKSGGLVFLVLILIVLLLIVWAVVFLIHNRYRPTLDENSKCKRKVTKSTIVYTHPTTD